MFNDMRDKETGKPVRLVVLPAEPYCVQCRNPIDGPCETYCMSCLVTLQANDGAYRTPFGADEGLR